MTLALVKAVLCLLAAALIAFHIPGALRHVKEDTSRRLEEMTVTKPKQAFAIILLACSVAFIFLSAHCLIYVLECVECFHNYNNIA